MKKILIIPDIRGWAVENMADNIINVLSDEFEFEKCVAEDLKQAERESYIKERYDLYDLIYIMVPGYIPKTMDIRKIITTFHGGPGIEGQADEIDRNGQSDLHISYVSNQVKDRVTEVEWKSNRKVWAPLAGTLEYKEIEIPKFFKEQKLDPKDVIKYKIEFPNSRGGLTPKNNRLPVNFHLWRKGFGLNNLKYFTPHGINSKEYKYTEQKKKGFTCGYAGWAKYILGKQKDHRRIYWIFEAQSQLKFNLHFAAGLHEYAGYETNILTMRYNRYPEIKFSNLEKKDMGRYYSGLDCYLVPDQFAGGPMPVLEAGLLGVPPVCSDAGLCGDIIEHMKTGYRYKKNDFRDFFMGIKFMRDNPEKRIEMGQNLQKYILENRTWEAVKPYWRKFFNAI